MEIVLAGRSNVGKSSVIRQLTGKKVLVGKRPGVTRRINRYQVGEMEIVDMPGFGFMSGISKARQERIKAEMVHYLETNSDKIVLALEVVDVRFFLDIAERWEKRGQIPVEVEFFSFLSELNLNPIVIANKIDLVHKEELDTILDGLAEKLGLSPPWRQWADVLVPMSAKTGEGVFELKKLIKEKMQAFGKGRLLGWLK